MRTSFAVENAVAQLGVNLRTARIKRRLTQKMVADRAGISLNTLSKLENGVPGIAVGIVGAVLLALGLDNALASVASPERDLDGMILEEAALPQRVRGRQSRKATGG